MLSDWPVSGGRPRQWLRTVNTPLNMAELEALHRTVERSQPFGNSAWVRRQVERFGLLSTMRAPGRPKNTH
ncbi:MAG: hypothetical protein KAS72_14270 [Phycisphaerales bacterium]|nr:hypothetical protein [Phycisphaerales bacterium]